MTEGRRIAVIAHLGELTEFQKQAISDAVGPHDVALLRDSGQGDLDACWAAVSGGAQIELYPDCDFMWRNHFERTYPYALVCVDEDNPPPSDVATHRMVETADQLMIVAPPDFYEWMNRSVRVKIAVETMMHLHLPVLFVFPDRVAESERVQA